MLSNAYLLAKFRFDTAENERHFAQILQFARRAQGIPGDRCGHVRGRQPVQRDRDHRGDVGGVLMAVYSGGE